MQIIAEVGSNWRKSDSKIENLDAAKRQIYLASKAGATAVKFQYFTAMELYGPEVKGTSFESNFNRFSLPYEWLPILRDECDRNGIRFLCSAFSVQGFKDVDDFVDIHKIASPETTAENLVDQVLKTGKPFYYSNGCSISWIAGGTPMACVSRYPAHHSDYNLGYYAQSDSPFGISDHTFSNDLAQFGLTLGVKDFEKHVDFMADVGLTSPDSIVSIDKNQFSSYANVIRRYDVEKYDKILSESYEKYGRRKTDFGYFRPIPFKT